MSEAELNIWEKALGWRKRQMIQRQLDPITNKIRNDTLEEVAKEVDNFKAFEKDTMASFAAYVRGLKR
jgi:wobble nucleotide-excising tRNase